MPRGRKRQEPKMAESNDSVNREPSNLESVLCRLADSMAQMQVCMAQLANSVPSNQSNVTGSEQVDEMRTGVTSSQGGLERSKSYIMLWKELGGTNLFFRPNGNMHPKFFLKKLEKLFLEAGVPENAKVGLAVECLRGSAVDWVTAKQDSFTNFEVFSRKFTDRYWGVEQERDLFCEIKYGKYTVGSRADYLLKMASQATYLSEGLEEGRLMEFLTKHFPPEIQRGIVTGGYKTLEEIEAYLKRIDETFSATEDRSSQQQERRGKYRPTGREPVRNIERLNESNGQQQQERREISIITTFTETEEVLRDVEEEGLKETVLWSPTIKAEIGQRIVEVLVDSGAQVSAVSEKFLRQLEQNGMVLPRLPVVGIVVGGAIGSDKQRIVEQAMIPVKLSHRMVEVNCVVVPKLTRDVIIGCDFMHKYDVKIDFQRMVMQCSFAGEISEIKLLSGVNEKHNITINFVEGFMKHQYKEEDFDRAVQKIEGDNGMKEQLRKLLLEFKDIFSECPGEMQGYEHEIVMTDESPFFIKPYPIPLVHREEVQRQIQEMLDWKIIEEARTEYISPLVTVKKKDGSVRICVDARFLNRRMAKDHVRPPNPNELFMTFQRGQVLSTLDLTSAYWQIPIRRDHRKYTGFLYGNKVYQFCRLPFGYSTSVASFIRGLTQVLGPRVASFTTAYVDDLLVFSKDFDEHMQHLEELLQRLREAGMTVKLRKSLFLRTEVPFVGHVLTAEGVKLDPKRIEALVKYERPKSIKELRGFLGAVNYDRRFCKDLAGLSQPLVRLLRKGCKWKWKGEEQAAFDAIKEAYLGAEVASHPNWARRFYVQTDASDYAIGGCLFQRDDQTGERRFIAFCSRVLRGAELSYSVTEKEGLAVVYALQLWRTILLGREVVVVTDHKALSFIMTTNIKSGRLYRWVMAIQEFDVTIEHCKGKDNLLADFLSRSCSKETLQKPEEGGSVCLSAIRLSEEYKQVKENFKRLGGDQRSDVWTEKIIKLLEHRMGSECSDKIVQWYALHESVLFRRGTDANPGYKLCVPRNQVVDLVLQQHVDMGHYGPRKIYDRMKQTFFWPKMRRDIRRIVSSCDVCQKAKVFNVCRGETHAVIPNKPGELVSVDLMGPLPRSLSSATYLFVVVDLFTKLVRLYAIKKASARVLLNKILTKYVQELGKPQAILSDNGSQFVSKVWRDGLSKEGIKVKNTSVYFPQGNATERVNREIGRLLRTWCHQQHKKWATMLPEVEFCINNSVHDSTGFAPNYLHFGKVEPNRVTKLICYPENQIAEVNREDVWVLARKSLLSKAERRRAFRDKTLKPTIFKEGDPVLVRNHNLSSAEQSEVKKFFLLFNGPYYVHSKVGPNAYLICDKDGRKLNKQNVVNLRPYHQPIKSMDQL